MTDERATVSRVAAYAGVSVASVSRVLNGLPASPAMSQRVQAAATALGYAPNAMARSLKVRRTQQLALAVPDVGNPVYVDLMRAIEAETRTEGFRLVVSSTGGSSEEAVAVLAGLAQGYADGLILSPLRVDDHLLAALRQLTLPVVVVGAIPDDLPVDSVRADSAAGVRLALEHLHDLGHRRIGFLNGPVDTVPGSARSEAFDRSARDLGLDSPPERRVVADDFTVAAGRAAAERLLAGGLPDAVLAANDPLAAGLLAALQADGREVPRDMAVVGMDDTELATVTTPALTSVSLGADERGRTAARLLLARLDDPGREVQRTTVAPRLQVRESTRPGAR